MSLSEQLKSLPMPQLGQLLRRSSSRRELRYAVQIKDQGAVIHVLIVNITAAGGLSPARIKEQLQGKCTNYCLNRYPGRALQLVVSGRIDGEVQ